MMRKLYRDNRGSTSLEVLLAIVLLMFILFITTENVILIYKQQVLEQAKMKGLDAMQIKGGLTADIEDAVKDYLSSRGFERENITIAGSRYPIQWGGDITLDVKYNYTYKKFKRVDLLSFSKVEETVQLNTKGSTTSYYFNNN